jgi:hypothetical protein
MKLTRPKEFNKHYYQRAFLRSSLDVLKWKLLRIKKNTTQFLSQKNITLDYSNQVLKDAIIKGEPFAAVRIGAVEMGCLHNQEKIQFGLTNTFKSSVRISMKLNAGFFPTDDKQLSFYAKHMMKDFKKTDILGISGIHMEEYFYQRYIYPSQVIQYEAFEPLRGDWIQALAGKRVLVVSPFADDIQKQYQKRKLLFAKGVLPDFTLITVKAVQTIADAIDPRYQNWFEALDAMKVEIMRHEFDIALIGAGAYGSHLCWFIKTMHKQAIQTGGATQTMFGMIGKRWQHRQHVSQYINDHWIHPTDKPLGWEKVEHGAYW